MKLSGYKVLLLVSASFLALIVVSPALQRLLFFPQTEFFTEFWLLGPEHLTANYPYNINSGENYRVYLGLENNLGSCGYYSIRIKLRNQTQSAPDSLKQTPSDLRPLYSLNVFVENSSSWELPVNFLFNYIYDANSDQIVFERLMFNDISIDISSFSTSWDSERGVYFANLVFELWIYNDVENDFQYHERYVDLKLNVVY